MRQAFILTAVLSVTGLAQVQIPDGTRIRVRLEHPVSSASAQEGETVSFSVADPVRVGDALVIVQGASATGTVTLAQERRRMGRSGKLDFSIERVRAVDGQWIPVRYTLTKKEGGSRSTTAGVTTGILAVAFWPAAPFALLMKGKDAAVPKGQIFEVFTDENHVLLNSRGALPGREAPEPAPPAGNVTVTVTSPAGGAEIEVDGVFVGNTPSTLQLASGTRRIKVKNGTQVWERTIQLQPGATITLAAAP